MRRSPSRCPATWIVAGLAAVCGTATVEAGTHVELMLHGRTREATVVAHQSGVCWIAEPDGTYTTFRSTEIKRFRPLPGPMQAVSTVKMRSQLRREYGSTFDVQSAGRHVVVADRSIATACARRCEEVSRAFRVYFGRRSVKLQSSPFPLPVVVARSRQEFIDFAATDNVTVDETLRGYYMRTSNRVLLYDAPSDVATRPQSIDVAWPSSLIVRDRTPAALFERQLADDDIRRSLSSPGLDSTLVHEVVHQVAYNTGLHSRTGGSPLWVIEGLAMMLEPDSVRKNLAAAEVTSRINRDRLEWFARQVRPGWQNGRLAEIVTTDRRFDVAPLDAYSEAWALTFFLSETRGSQYAAYLRSQAARTELHEPTENERLAAFRGAFGRDLGKLEVRWLRWMEELNAAARR